VKRRGFLGRLLAVPLAVKTALSMSPKPLMWLDEPADFAEVGAALKEAYPPGLVEEAVNARSPFLTYLKGSANLENQMPKSHAIITDLKDPAEDEDWEITTARTLGLDWEDEE